METPHDSDIPLLNIFPKELKSEYFSDTCIPMFIAAQLTIGKLTKLSRCPSIDEWIKKVWYIHTMEFYSSIRKNKIISFVGKWMDLEDIC